MYYRYEYSTFKVREFGLLTVVCNRPGSIHQIQSLLPDCQWHHVPSENNPADCASRGLLPSELVDNVLFWNGPTFLNSPTAEWVVRVPFIQSDRSFDVTIIGNNSLPTHNCMSNTLAIIVGNYIPY